MTGIINTIFNILIFIIGYLIIKPRELKLRGLDVVLEKMDSVFRSENRTTIIFFISQAFGTKNLPINCDVYLKNRYIDNENIILDLRYIKYSKSYFEFNRNGKVFLQNLPRLRRISVYSYISPISYSIILITMFLVLFFGHSQAFSKFIYPIVLGFPVFTFFMIFFIFKAAKLNMAYNYYNSLPEKYRGELITNPFDKLLFAKYIKNMLKNNTSLPEPNG